MEKKEERGQNVTPPPKPKSNKQKFEEGKNVTPPPKPKPKPEEKG